MQRVKSHVHKEDLLKYKRQFAKRIMLMNEAMHAKFQSQRKCLNFWNKGIVCYIMLVKQVTNPCICLC